MRVWIALLAIAVLFGVVYAGVGLAGQHYLFGVIIPYLSIVVLLAGLVYKILKWAGAPVPFRVPTVSGQQKSLPFLEHDKLESPATGMQTVGRMALEILLFRSLFRNTRVDLTPTQRVVHQSDKWLWAAALAFHWTFLLVLIRHLRFFLEPTPALVAFIESLDGFFQLTSPTFLISSAVLGAALLFLLGRRLADPQVRFISLPADYFVLFLLLSIVGSGIFMRYITKTDLLGAKELSMGLVTLQPVVPAGVGLPFYIHLFLICVLFVYFPFSKLMHLGGAILSPTRNLANNNRARRHINPWNPDIEGHTYRQWEDEFKDKLEAAGMPLDPESK